MARAMQAIAHPLRLKILCVLGEHELSVQDIVEAVGLRRATSRNTWRSSGKSAF